MSIFENIKGLITPMQLCGYLAIEVKNGFIHCIIHEEKTASMRVYKDNFFCCGCNTKLDVIDFLSAYNHISLKQSLEILSSLTGITISNDNLQKIKEEKMKMENKKKYKRWLEYRFNSYYNQVCERLRELRKLRSIYNDVYKIQINENMDTDNCVTELGHIQFEEMCLHNLLDSIQIKNTINGLEKNIRKIKKGCKKLIWLRGVFMNYDEILNNIYNCGFELLYEEEYYWLKNIYGKYRFCNFAQINGFLLNLN